MKSTLADVPSTLTARELSGYLKVHPSTIYRLLKTGQLPAFRVASDWRFNVEQIERWLVEREQKPNTQALPCRLVVGRPAMESK